MQIHLSRQNQKLGTFTLDEVNAQLRDGRLRTADTLAWHEGLPEWVPLARIQGIAVPAQPEAGDATGGLIPYKNPMALAAYYTGIAALIPCLGFVAAIVAIVLGVKGLKHYKAHPATRGVVHAWVGIGLAGLSLLVHGIIGIITMAGIVAAGRH